MNVSRENFIKETLKIAIYSISVSLLTLAVLILSNCSSTPRAKQIELINQQRPDWNFEEIKTLEDSLRNIKLSKEYLYQERHISEYWEQVARTLNK